MPLRNRRRQQVARLTIGALLASVINAGHASEFIWIQDSYLQAGLPSPLGAGQTVLALSGSGKKWDASFTNNGTVRWETTDQLTLSGSGTTFVNRGLLDIAADARIHPISSNISFENIGTLRKSGGSGITVINSTFVNRAGAHLDATSGFIQYNGATTFEAGTVFLASNGGQHVFDTNAITYYFNGAFSAPDHSLAFLDGTYLNAGPSPLTLPGNFQWNGGTFRGDWHVDEGKNLKVVSGTPKEFNGRFVNDGNLTWETTDQFTLSGSGTTFVNRGLLDIAADARIHPISSNISFENIGTLRKSGGSGITVINSTFVNRAGAHLDATSGFIQYNGATTFEAGTVFLASNGGQHVFDTNAITYYFNGAFSAPDHSLAFLDGTYLNAGPSPLTLPGNFQWNGGTFRGDWHVDEGKNLKVVSGTPKEFNGRFVNDGNLTWETTDQFTLSGSGTTFVNRGLLDIAADARIHPISSNISFENIGTLRLNETARLLLATSIDFINRGTVELNGNRLDVRNDWTNEGLIRGNGDLGTSHLMNAGRLTPGDIAEASTPLSAALRQIGTLNFLGDLTLAEGSELILDLGADGASDRINISGDIVLGGLLRLNLLDGIELEIGDTFRILTFAHGSQLFSGFSYITPGRLLTLEYGDQYIDVRVAAVPEPTAWSAMLAGLLVTVVAVRRRRQT